MKKYFSMKKMISVLCALVLIVTAVFEPSWFGKANGGMDEVSAATEAPPTDFVELSWKDFTGLSHEKYTSDKEGTYSGAATLNRTLLNDDITMGKESYIRYGGNSWNSFQIQIVADDNNSYLCMDAGPMGTVVEGTEYVGPLITDDEFELNSLVDTRFNLKISTEVLDNGNYKFGIWINDIMAGGYITIQPNANCTGTSAIIHSAGNGVALDKVVRKAPTDFVELSWKDFTGLSHEKYTSDKEGTYSGAATLNRTLLNDDITMGKESYIRYGGNSWSSFQIQIVADDNNSYLCMDAGPMGTVVAGTGYVGSLITDDEFELNSLVDTRFNLKISTEVLDNGNYKFGIWINDIMAGGYITIQPNANCTGTSAIIHSAGNGVTLDKVVRKAPTDFVELSWKDFTGLSHEKYTSDKEGTYSGAATLNRTLLNDDITMGKESYIRYGGNSWSSFQIQIVADDNNSYLCMDAGPMGTVVAGTGYVGSLITDDEFELNSLVDTRFNLKISTEVLDNGNYKFGIWINDIMAGGYITIQPNANCTGTSAIIHSAGNGVTLDKVVRKAPTDFTKLTWADFESLSYKKYEVNGYDSLSGTYNGSLHKTLLEDEINIANNTSIRYAGVGSTTGFKLTFVKDTSYNYIYPESNGYGTVVAGKSYVDNGLLTHTSLGMEPFVGETINLKISTEIYGDYYKFGIWINDVMMGDYITIKTDASANMRGTTVSFTEDDSNTTTVELIRAGSTPPTDFTTLIWTDFEDLQYAEYSDKGVDATAGEGNYSGAQNLHQTLLNDNVILGHLSEIRYGGDGWYGLGLQVAADAEGNSFLYVYDHWNGGTTLATLTNPSDYNLNSFVEEEFNLKISTEIDGTNFRFGVWVNNVLVNYYTLNTNGNGGTTVGLHGRGAGNSVVLVKQEIAPPTDFTTLGWNDFAGLICKEYEAPNPDTTGAKGTYSDSLHQTLLDGNIIFGKNTDIRYGSTGWHGIALHVASDGSVMYVLDAWNSEANKGTFAAKDFGLSSFADTEFNLKISTEVNGDSCTFGVWVNNQILGKYITLTKSAETSIGSSVGLYHRGSNNNIQLVGEKVPTDYTILTPLTTFGIVSGSYTAPNGNDAVRVDTPPREGVTVDKFDKVILQFHKITFEGEVDLGFGGENVWVGYRIGSRGDNLILHSGYSQLVPSQVTFTDAIAGVDVVGGTYNLKISMVYTDDGTAIQMGIWFDDILYNNEYFVLDISGLPESGGDALGNHLGVISQVSGGTITFGEEEITLDNFYWNLADGTYTLPTGAKYVEGGEVSELATTGEHYITYSANGKIFERTVYIWQIGDIIEDDATNSCDLVRIKQLSIGNGGQTSESGKEAADFDKDDDIDATDVHSMRRLLVGDEFDFEKTVSEKLLGGVIEDAANVMPIVGFKGPSSPLTVTATNGKTYTSQNMVTADIYDKIAGLGINLITGYDDVYTDSNKEVIEQQLSLAEERNLAVLVSEGRLAGNVTPSSEELQACLDSYKNYKSFAGLDIVDEPKNDSYPDNTSGNYTNTPLISDWSALGKKVNQYGDLTGYVNLFPYWSTLGTTTTYQSYLTEYIEAFQPQYLSYDYYVFSRIDESGIGETTAYDEQMKNLTMLREAAKTNNIPFWSFVQAGSNWNDDVEIMSATSNGTPSKGEFNWQANIALAFGAKGISYFPLIQPHYFALTRSGILWWFNDPTMDYDRNGLIAADGSTTIWYDYAQEVNKQIASIDDVLMNATNKGLVVSGGTAASHINSNLDALCAEPLVLSDYKEFTGVTTTGTSAGAAVGCFDYKGQTALYVVNYDMTSSQTITLTFNQDVSAEVRQLQGGAASTATASTSSQQMSVTLGAGEGALVVLK